MFDFFKPANWSPELVGVRSAWAILRQQAENCVRTGNLEEAERLYRRAIAEQSAAPRMRRIEMHLDLAEVQRKKAASELAHHPDSPVPARRQMLAPAERTIIAAIEIATNGARNSDPLELVVCLDALGEVFADAGDFKALEKVERQVLRAGTQLRHPDIGWIAGRTHRLALTVHRNGRTEETARLLTKSVELHEKRYGPNSVEVAEVLTDCGAIFREMGDHERAKQCLQRSLRIRPSHGAYSAETFSDVQQLARVLEESGDLDGAAVHYERALLMKMRKVGFENLEEIAEMQYHLANLYVGWGNLGRARELMEEAIGEFRRHGGPRLAVALEMLAQLEEGLGHFNTAVQELEKAGKAWEKCGPSRSLELIRNLDYRADLLEQLRRTKDAKWLRQRMAEIQTTMTAQA